MTELLALREWLAVPALLLTFVVFLPYIHGILRARVRPHLFSWLIWGINTGIAFLAALAAGGGWGAWVIGFSALVTLGIAALAWVRRADVSITASDWAFLVAALAAMPLWLLLDDPLAAVLLITLVELLGFGPTLRKTWIAPHSESIPFFALLVLRNALVIAALEQHNLATVLFPAAMAAACVLLVLVMAVRRLHGDRRPP